MKTKPVVSVVVLDVAAAKEISADIIALTERDRNAFLPHKYDRNCLIARNIQLELCFYFTETWNMDKDFYKYRYFYQKKTNSCDKSLYMQLVSHWPYYIRSLCSVHLQSYNLTLIPGNQTFVRF